MITTSRIISKLIKEYNAEGSLPSVDSRIIVPGLTAKIAEEIHQELISDNINSFLVISSNRKPNKELRWLPPLSLTTMRLGSFVAVTDPGALADIHDSIRGSGGAIRSIAYSEEWPWINTGTEAFRFDGPFLINLLSNWKVTDEQKTWFKEIICNVLIDATRQEPNRASLFLEEMLGLFINDNDEGALDSRFQFLYHCGIPKPENITINPKELAGKTRDIVKKIIERIQAEPDLRNQVKENIPAEDKDRDKLCIAIDAFFDGLSNATSLSNNILSLRSCWGSTSLERKSNWSILTLERLKQIFSINDPKEVLFQASILKDDKGVIVSPDGKTAATSINKIIFVNTVFEIPESVYIPDKTKIKVFWRRKLLKEISITSHNGFEKIDLNILDLQLPYKNAISLRFSISIEDKQLVEENIKLHICGEQRPAFILVSPSFNLCDASIPDEGDQPTGSSYIVDLPFKLHLFNNNDTPPCVVRENGENVQLVHDSQIWSTSENLDASSSAGGRLLLRCELGSRNAEITFEAKDIVKGAFTLEEELRHALVFSRKDRLKHLLRMHSEPTSEPYPYLGGITEQTRRRSRLARFFEESTGWRPILADIFKSLDSVEVAHGDFVRSIGHLHDQIFDNIALSSKGISLLDNYVANRNTLRDTISKCISRNNSSLDYPDYALCPIFHSGADVRMQKCETDVHAYLQSYLNIQEYLLSNEETLSWHQIFILTYLDCIVQWSNNNTKNTCFLVGPWHPMVVSKRFLIQRALVNRGERLIDENDNTFSELTELLSNVSGFYWLPSLKAEDIALEPAYVSSTSDPGWHFAFKSRAVEGNASDSRAILPSAVQSLKLDLNLDLKVHLPSSGAMVSTVLGSYSRTFPSKRHIGIFFPKGFAGEDEILATNDFLHQEEEVTPEGLRLSGGINISFENEPSVPENITWGNPPIKVFHYKSREDCFNEQYPDLQFCLPDDQLRFLDLSKPKSLPRGKGYNKVFAQGISRLTTGQSSLPQSISEEWDTISTDTICIGDLFEMCCSRSCELASRSFGLVYSTNLPQRLDTSWSVVPGAILDPAIFVKYVIDGSSRKLEERSLWDYRISLSKGGSSYFIMSTIPAAFKSAVNGLFSDGKDHASEFVSELGEVGLAIAGEAMKSGRHALGAVGLVGAVRLLIGGAQNDGPLKWAKDSVGILIPVDSFRDLLDGSIKTSADSIGSDKRADLLAISLKLPCNKTDHLVIKAVAVECKFYSKIFPDQKVNSALSQAAATTERFKKLCLSAVLESGIPERIGLLQLIRFGIRVNVPRAEQQGIDYQDIERIVYDCILSGRFKLEVNETDSVLISSELALPGSAEANKREKGVWIRLNKENWPGIADTESLSKIKEVLAKLFVFSNTVCKNTATNDQIQPTTLVKIESPEKSDSEISDITVRNMMTVDEPPIVVLEQSVAGAHLKPVLVGVDSARRSVSFDPHSPIDRLDNANMMITGSPGKGKTQLIKYLVTAIRKQGVNILLLDFKNDFASDLHFVNMAGIKPVYVAFDGLPFNPLIPNPVRHPQSGDLFLQCSQHIAGISAVLRRTYGLGPQQEAAVKQAIRQSFLDSGIDPSKQTPYSGKIIFPDLSQIGQILEQTSVATFNRLDPLFTLDLFSEKYRKVSFADMLNNSAALDFSQIPSDSLKNALAELVILSAHSYYNSQAHCGLLRQIFVVDEAHRILTADYLERFAKECRAYGVSLILASQYPSDFPADISATLNTKIIHGNDRDTDLVRNIVNLLGCNEREADIADLGMFEAIFSNKHFRNVFIRTLTYPVYLVLTAINESGGIKVEEIALLEGVDVSKLSINNITNHLERLGLCEIKNGSIYPIS